MEANENFKEKSKKRWLLKAISLFVVCLVISLFLRSRTVKDVYSPDYTQNETVQETLPEGAVYYNDATDSFVIQSSAGGITLTSAGTSCDAIIIDTASADFVITPASGGEDIIWRF